MISIRISTVRISKWQIFAFHYSHAQNLEFHNELRLVGLTKRCFRTEPNETSEQSITADKFIHAGVLHGSDDDLLGHYLSRAFI